MFFLLILSFIKASDEIDPFLDKDVKIIFSAYSHIHLSELQDGTIGGFNRYLSPKKFLYDDTAKISKNGDGYEIQIGGSKICRLGNKVGRCKGSPNVWSIEKRTFGYNIKQGNMCITQKEYDKLEMRKCNEENDKIFAIKLSSQSNDCEELKEKSNNTTQPLPKINVITLDSSSDSNYFSSDHSDRKHSDSHLSSVSTDNEYEKISLTPRNNKKIRYKVKKRTFPHTHKHHEITEESSHYESIRKGKKEADEFLGLN